MVGSVIPYVIALLTVYVRQALSAFELALPKVQAIVMVLTMAIRVAMAVLVTGPISPLTAITLIAAITVIAITTITILVATIVFIAPIAIGVTVSPAMTRLGRNTWRYQRRGQQQ